MRPAGWRGDKQAVPVWRDGFRGRVDQQPPRLLADGQCETNLLMVRVEQQQEVIVHEDLPARPLLGNSVA